MTSILGYFMSNLKLKRVAYLHEYNHEIYLEITFFYALLDF